MEPKLTKCPTHDLDFQLIEGAMRCPFAGCHQFVEIDKPAAEGEAEAKTEPAPEAEVKPEAEAKE